MPLTQPKPTPTSRHPERSEEPPYWHLLLPVLGSFHRKLLVTFLLTWQGLPIYAQSPNPRPDLFAKYQVKVPAHLGSAKLNFADPDIHAFRTRFRYAAQHGAIFAGHYRSAIWGCGTGCIVFSIIDVETGEVYPFPGSISQVNEIGERLTFHKDSRALHVIGSINERDSADRWYVWNGKEFRLLSEKPSQLEPAINPGP